MSLGSSGNNQKISEDPFPDRHADDGIPPMMLVWLKSSSPNTNVFFELEIVVAVSTNFPKDIGLLHP